VTAPQSNDSSSSSSSPRPRVGQVVTYRQPDPFHPEGKELTGHGVVLFVPTDEGAAVTVAPLAEHHLQVAPDRLAPVKAGEVPSTIAQPDTAGS